MKKAILFLLTLTVCFSLFSPLAVAATQNDSEYYIEYIGSTEETSAIVPFGTDLRNVTKKFTFKLYSKATGQAIDTLTVTVTGIVSATTKEARLVDIESTFANNLFYIKEKNIFVDSGVIEVAYVVYRKSVRGFIFTITYTGAISVEEGILS